MEGLAVLTSYDISAWRSAPETKESLNGHHRKTLITGKKFTFLAMLPWLPAHVAYLLVLDRVGTYIWHVYYYEQHINKLLFVSRVNLLSCFL